MVFARRLLALIPTVSYLSTLRDKPPMWISSLVFSFSSLSLLLDIGWEIIWQMELRRRSALFWERGRCSFPTFTVLFPELVHFFSTATRFEFQLVLAPFPPIPSIVLLSYPVNRIAGLCCIREAKALAMSEMNWWFGLVFPGARPEGKDILASNPHLPF
jgi:hypothetical protein